ncbi:MAG: D-alanyl-D-alanine carboxypeptidase family protein [Victivallaceae bacterium]
MKKYVSFLLILGVIVGVHFVVVKMFFSGNKATAVKPVEEKKAEVVPERKWKYKQPSSNPLFGRYFSYKNTINGEIKGIPETKEAKSGILVNMNTREVLWAKNPRDGVPIASMTKMMTLLLIFEAMEQRPDLSFETPVHVTAAAQKIGGSQVYLDPKETFPLGELLKAMAIKSANDAAYLTAEFVSGKDVDGFVAQMDARAKKLHMPNTKYANPHGLSNASGENSISSAEGMAILSERLMEYPQILKWTSTIHDDFRPKGSKGWQLLTNTNYRILQACPGTDGMKTGYISQSGFCVTVSCLRGGTRIVAVLTGFATPKSRNSCAQKLLDWGYKRSASMHVQQETAVAKEMSKINQ